MREKHDLWYWYQNVSECSYHIQITVKSRRALIDKRVEGVIVESMRGLKERYAIEILAVGLDRNDIHIRCRFLPKYSGGQGIRRIKRRTAQKVFQEVSEVKRELWGGEFWTEGDYRATIRGRGNKKVIEGSIRKQGRQEDSAPLKLFEI